MKTALRVLGLALSLIVISASASALDAPLPGVPPTPMPNIAAH